MTQPSSSTRSFYDVDDETTKRDIGSQPGTTWTLSSFKQGSGVAELRSRDMSKLWQSDGTQPHLITLTFSRLTHLTHLSLFLDVRQDDSYTPTKLCIKAGTHFSDLITVRTRTFESPQGWKHFLLGKADPSIAEEEEEEKEKEEEEEEEEEEEDMEVQQQRKGIWCWTVQVCVLANYLNGKDTHVRRCVVWGPREEEGEQRNEQDVQKGRELEDEQEAIQLVKRALVDDDEVDRSRSTQTTPPVQQTSSISLDGLLNRAYQSNTALGSRTLSRFGNLR